MRIRLPTSEVTLVVDGKYLVYRSQYGGNSANLEYGGKLTGLYYMFFNTLRQLTYKFNPANMVIMWDGGRNVRKDEYPTYKERNKNIKPEQLELMQRIKHEYPCIVSMCSRMGFAGYSLDGYEADDLIALFCQRFNYINKIIITRDEDMYQCLDSTTSIYSPDDKQRKNLEWFVKTYEINPNQWGIYKSLAGCNSDNVSGIPGVGEKTALEILKGTVNQKAMDKLETHKELWNLCKRLTVLPHPNLKNHRIKFKQTRININQMAMEFQKMGMRSLLEKLSDFKSLT